MLYTLKNEYLTVTVSDRGAELQSVRRADGREYLWQGDSTYWGERAPVLFPLCGRLWGGTYTWQGNTYTLGLHGFARHKAFEVTSCAVDRITMMLTPDDETRISYPFSFRLSVTYALSDNTLTETITVANEGEGILPFSFGGHPGFLLPLMPDRPFEDHYLDIHAKTAPRRLCLTDKGFLTGERVPASLRDGHIIDLDRHFFDDDGIFLDMTGGEVSVRLKNSTAAVTVRFDGMRCLGIWQPAHTDAPFLCVEPWHGTPSVSGCPDDFSAKADMIRLAPGETYSGGFSVTFTV